MTDKSNSEDAAERRRQEIQDQLEADERAREAERQKRQEGS